MQILFLAVSQDVLCLKLAYFLDHEVSLFAQHFDCVSGLFPPGFSEEDGQPLEDMSSELFRLVGGMLNGMMRDVFCPDESAQTLGTEALVEGFQKLFLNSQRERESSKWIQLTSGAAKTSRPKCCIIETLSCRTT